MFEGTTCVFTVVPDPLLAIEATEYTAFNMIFISEDSQSGLSAAGLISSLRMVGSDVPVVLLRDSAADSSEELAAQVSQCDRDEAAGGGSPTAGANEGLFAATLRKPFTKRDLCDVIRSALFPQFHRVGGEQSSIGSDEDYRLCEDEMST
jgi:CheY-like chemotaxis protein